LLYRAKFSANSERVALALAHKELTVESRYIAYDDRSEVERVSGQGLVPVLVDGKRVVVDSMDIVAYLEELAPAPPLYPEDAARRAEMEIFIDWFNGVWKGPPNEIEAAISGGSPDPSEISRLGAEMTVALDTFERMLSGREYLFGDEFSAADCAAFPFLKYALSREREDDELFHRIFDEYQLLCDHHVRLPEWIDRIDGRPRA
jgi:maleylacetoacetate isomerase